MIHRTETHYPTAKCYLVSAVEIKDWDTGINPYKSEVTLYRHHGAVVHVWEVRKKITDEIRQYCLNFGLPTTDVHINAMYGEICLFLDDEVAKMHRTSAKKRQYKIPFSNVMNCLDTATDEISNAVAFELHEKLYDHIVKSVHTAIDHHCLYECDIHRLHELCGDKDCSVQRLSEAFLNHNDVCRYIEIINPSESAQWCSLLDYSSHAADDVILNRIIYPFSLNRTPALIKCVNDAIAIEAEFCTSKNKIVIPTLLDLTTNQYRGSDSLQRTLQKIKDNHKIRNAIAGNTLLARENTSLDANLLTEQQINSQWKNLIKSHSHPETINDIYEGTEIISENEFIREMKARV